MKKKVPVPGNTEYKLYEQLLYECQAMASHSLASGMKVPGNLLQTLFQCGEANQSEETKVGAEDKPVGSCGELHLRVNQLAQVHDRLTEIVFPATPAPSPS